MELLLLILLFGGFGTAIYFFKEWVNPSEETIKKRQRKRWQQETNQQKAQEVRQQQQRTAENQQNYEWRQRIDALCLQAERDEITPSQALLKILQEERRSELCYLDNNLDAGDAQWVGGYLVVKLGNTPQDFFGVAPRTPEGVVAPIYEMYQAQLDKALETSSTLWSGWLLTTLKKAADNQLAMMKLDHLLDAPETSAIFGQHEDSLEPAWEEDIIPPSPVTTPVDQQSDFQGLMGIAELYYHINQVAENPDHELPDHILAQMDQTEQEPAEDDLLKTLQEAKAKIEAINPSGSFMRPLDPENPTPYESHIISQTGRNRDDE